MKNNEAMTTMKSVHRVNLIQALLYRLGLINYISTLGYIDQKYFAEKFEK